MRILKMVINVIVIKVTTINVIIMAVIMLKARTTLSFAGSIWWKLQEVDHTGLGVCTNGVDLTMMLMMTMRVMQMIIIMWMENHDCDDVQSHNHDDYCGGDLYQDQYWRSYLV